MLNTQLSASTGMLGWLICERTVNGKYTVVGVLKGILCGLIAITPGSGFVDINGGVFIGLIASIVGYAASYLKTKFNIDDYYDAFGLHVVGGTVGGILVAFFSRKEYCPSCPDGVLYTSSSSGWHLLGKQIIGIAVTSAWSIVCTYGLVKLVDYVFVFRVSEEDELLGLDSKLHGSNSNNGVNLTQVPDHHKPFYNLQSIPSASSFDGITIALDSDTVEKS